MRRYFTLILFFVVLITPFILQRLMGSATDAPMPVEGDAEQLVILSPHVEGIRREFAQAFAAWYGKPVFVDYRSYGGASDIVKFFEASQETVYKKQGTYNIDLVWGGGDYLFDRQLKRPGYLQKIDLDPAILKAAFPSPTLAGLPLYDLAPDGPQWIGTALSSFGIVYNKDVVKYLHLPEPRTWADLADPKYRGWIVLADPTRSASAKTAFMIIVERAMQTAQDNGGTYDHGWAKGMGLIRQISANARIFADASSAVPSMVATGDVAAGMAIDFYARSQMEAVGGDRMGYVEPAGATLVNPDPIGLVKGAKHRALAMKFIEFVLSEQGQKLWNTRAGAPGGPKSTSLRRLPIRRSTYDDMSNFTDPVNPFKSIGGFNTRNDRKRTFGIMGELIGYSCIDLLDDLRDTRAAILASPRAAELDAQLGTFPFDESEALSRDAQLRKAAPAERLKLQRDWTEEFRQEYARLRAEAGK
jgi:ABC-type Fe3+ transport system substrate-binding protein